MPKLDGWPMPLQSYNMIRWGWLRIKRRPKGTASESLAPQRIDVDGDGRGKSLSVHHFRGRINPIVAKWANPSTEIGLHTIAVVCP
jgi:hypothetical protein